MLKINYQLFLAAITIPLCIGAAYRLCPASFPLFLILYLWHGYWHNFTILRQGLAAAICFFAITFFSKKNIYNFLFLIIIAASLHYSTIFLLPLFLLCKKVSCKFTLIVAVALCWILSAYHFLLNFNFSFLNILIRERWSNLLDIEELTTKIGISYNVIEYSILALIAVLFDSSSEQAKFAKGVLICRIILYGLFNDISIMWERTNSFFDPMYAAAVPVILLMPLKQLKFSKDTQKIVEITLFFVLILYVNLKYFRLFKSECRVVGEKSHYERFFPYHSIFNKN